MTQTHRFNRSHHLHPSRRLFWIQIGCLLIPVLAKASLTPAHSQTVESATSATLEAQVAVERMREFIRNRAEL